MTENLLTASLDPGASPEAPPAAETKTATTGRNRPEGLPEKFWDDNKREIRLDALIKSYVELERKLGNTATRPIPARPEDYQLSVQGDFLSPDLEINRQLHAAGFTQDQAQLVYNLAADRLMPLVSEIAALFEAQTQIDRLCDEFGGEQRWREVARQLDAWGQTHLPQRIFDALSTTYEGVVAMYRMMSGGEPELHASTRGADAVLSDTALKQLMRDPRYWRDQDPAMVNRVRDGFKRLYKSGNAA